MNPLKDRLFEKLWDNFSFSENQLRWKVFEFETIIREYIILLFIFLLSNLRFNLPRHEILAYRDILKLIISW